MKVELIAHTVATQSWRLTEPQWRVGVDAATIDRLAEFAGRACYQSWSNPSGKNNAEYLGNIIDQQHFSVLEHASATFYVQGVSRALTHELVRHRHLSYSQLSQRFVDESDVAYVPPPALVGLPEAEHDLGKVMDQARTIYADITTYLSDQGFSRKQAREAARAVLPNMTETKIVVTGNMRAWRGFLAKRHNSHADAEIQLFAGLVLDHLKGIAPNTFQDIPVVPA